MVESYLGARPSDTVLRSLRDLTSRQPVLRTRSGAESDSGADRSAARARRPPRDPGSASARALTETAGDAVRRGGGGSRVPAVRRPAGDWAQAPGTARSPRRRAGGRADRAGVLQQRALRARTDPRRAVRTPVAIPALAYPPPGRRGDRASPCRRPRTASGGAGAPLRRGRRRRRRDEGGRVRRRGGAACRRYARLGRRRSALRAGSGPARVRRRRHRAPRDAPRRVRPRPRSRRNPTMLPRRCGRRSTSRTPPIARTWPRAPRSSTARSCCRRDRRRRDGPRARASARRAASRPARCPAGASPRKARDGAVLDAGRGAPAGARRSRARDRARARTRRRDTGLRPRLLAGRRVVAGPHGGLRAHRRGAVPALAIDRRERTGVARTDPADRVPARARRPSRLGRRVGAAGALRRTVARSTRAGLPAAAAIAPRRARRALRGGRGVHDRGRPPRRAAARLDDPAAELGADHRHALDPRAAARAARPDQGVG